MYGRALAGASKSIRHKRRIERCRQRAPARRQLRHDDADAGARICGEARCDPVGHLLVFVVLVQTRCAPRLRIVLRRLESLAQRAARDQGIEQLLLLRRRFVEACQHYTRWRRDSARFDVLANDIGQARLIGGTRCLDAPLVLAGPA